MPDLIPQADQEELRRLVTEHSGEELTVLEGYNALLSVLDQRGADCDRLERLLDDARRQVAELEVYRALFESSPRAQKLRRFMRDEGERAVRVAEGRYYAEAASQRNTEGTP